MARKKRYSFRKKYLHLSRLNIEALILGIVELVLLFLALDQAFTGNDSMMSMIAIVGVIFIFVSFVNVILSFRGLFMFQYNLLGRWAALLISLASMALWLGVYLVGLTSIWK